MRFSTTFAALAVSTCLVASLAQAEMAREESGRDEAIELVDGDRVVFLGSTLVEREQASGYWEAMLTRRWPERNILFRNLGWSGDNVWAEARAGFGTVADGFRELKEHLDALRPSVIFVAYGANEAFAGQPGLAHFEQGLQALLDMLAGTRARIVIVSPPPQEEVGPPLPSAAPHNRDLAIYRDALRRAAQQRGAKFLDLFELLGGTKTLPQRLTDNGLHLTPGGYAQTAPLLESTLGVATAVSHVELDAGTGRSVGRQEANSAKLVARREVRAERLPLCASPVNLLDPAGRKTGLPSDPPAQFVRCKGLSPGRYVLKIDGHTVAAASASEWAAGQPIRTGPDVDQAEALRAAIVAKNQLYFYRWRPQNITYLTGFRKHEQGQNAKEVAEFDPLIAQQEEKIAHLRMPQPRKFELIQESEEAK